MRRALNNPPKENSNRMAFAFCMHGRAVFPWRTCLSASSKRRARKAKFLDPRTNEAYCRPISQGVDAACARLADDGPRAGPADRAADAHVNRDFLYRK